MTNKPNNFKLCSRSKLVQCVVVCFQECQGLFIESSAKDGKNVLEAVTELSR